ncbi:MAG: hypothetical protein QOI07_1919 [Verrucomicrobiota bacterium]|jgi:hypothetical protein
MGLWPVRPAELHSRCEGEAIDNGQNVRWAHRPEVYVPSQSFGLLAAQARGLCYGGAISIYRRRTLN